MFFDNTDFNYEISLFQIPGSDFSIERVDNFLSPEEGFLRGNLVASEYVPYKNYTYFKLNPETEREKLLYQLMAYSFAINDLNLYLDLHPDDAKGYNLFRKYSKDVQELENRYVQKFGPITVNETNGNTFNWIDNPWPWDKQGGARYV